MTLDLPPPPLPDIERQIHFETEAVELGVQRYRRAIAEADLADTPPGLEAARDMLKTLIPAIREAQSEAVDGIANGPRGIKPRWWWLIGFLSAEKLAFITARAILTTKNKRDHASGLLFTSASLALGRHVRQELEFDMWRRAEAAKVKEAKEAGEQRVNLYKVLTERAKKVDAKAFQRWRQKIADIERLDWDRDARLAVGVKLLTLAAKHGGGWFEIILVPTRGKTERRIVLTEIARDAISDVNSRLEINRPFLLPMVCQPKPWRKADEADPA